MFVLHAAGNWLYNFFGVKGSGPYYGFWSGAGSDISEIALIGAVVTFYRHNKCQTCWRIAHHKVVHTPYKTCHKHTTMADHKRLVAHHAKNHPEQHALLKSR